jgi:hypothetical protein
MVTMVINIIISMVPLVIIIQLISKAPLVAMAPILLMVPLVPLVHCNHGSNGPIVPVALMAPFALE